MRMAGSRARLTARGLLAAAAVLSAAACGGGDGSDARDTLASPSASETNGEPSPSVTTGARTSEPGASTATAPASPTASPTASARALPTQSPVEATPSPPAAVATGVVRDASWAPVPNVMVGATSLDSPSKGVPELAVFSDSAGRYSWPAVLAPGTYELRAQTPDGPSVARVDVRAGVTATVDLRYRADD